MLGVGRRRNSSFAPSSIISLLLASCAHSLTLVPSSSTASIRIGTRSSKLALNQVERFQSALQKRVGSSQAIITEVVHIDTKGDKREQQGTTTPTQKLPLAVSGVDFTGALDEAVMNGDVDVAVHSLKDIPPESRWIAPTEENLHLVIGAVLGPRATPFDVLISKNDDSIASIQSLPKGARVGSASIRRQAQLKACRPELNVINIRGNVDARLKALDYDVDALILAMAGLQRLDILDEENSIIQVLGKKDNDGSHQDRNYHYKQIPIETMLPGLGQGIIAITCRSDNFDMLSLLKEIDDHDSRIAATTERAFLDVVQKISPWVGRPPLAGFMRPSDNLTWVFDGLLATPDGARVVRAQRTIDDSNCNEETAQHLGRAAGEDILREAGDGFLDGFY